MNIKPKYFILLAVAFFLTACDGSKEKVLQPVNDPSVSNQDTPLPTLEIVATETEEPKISPTNLQNLFTDYDTKLIAFLKIYNSEKSQYTAKKEDIFESSSEGGYILREYKDDVFISYTSVFLGEMGKTQFDFYKFSDFIYLIETSETYNAPFYYTEKRVAVDNLDIEPFDPKKSTISTKEYIKDNEYLYRMDREKKELIIVQDSDEINTFKLCEENVLIKSTEQPLSENLPSSSFSKYNIFAINSLLLGGYFNNKWFDNEALFPIIGETEYFKIYTNGLYRGVAKGTKEASSTQPILVGNSINFEQNESDDLNEVFAFSGSTDLNIEYGTKLSVESEVYQNSMIEYMISEGYRGELLLDNILKFDIEKDGTDEVFISAWNLPDLKYPEHGDEILYMRKIVDGKVKNISFPITDPITSSDTKTIIGFCDLNGDGVSEIVVEVRGIGYMGYAVFELKENRIIRIFANGYNT